MTEPANRNGRINRRGFLELGSAALLSTRCIGDAKAAPLGEEHRAQTAKQASESTAGKIALEEHFGLPESVNYAGKDLPTAEDRARFFDLVDRRIADMDRGGLEICILSLGAPGVQAVADFSKSHPVVAASE